MTPLVSILLPTRNRLHYLRDAVETVRLQDDGDWELVISDNDSQEDVAGYVRSLDDTRIRYVRTPAFVPVTDNWNNALRNSRGRYVVMLGDDDGLMPGYVREIRALAERFDSPDLIYQSAWLLTYPGVDRDEPEGFLQAYGYAKFLRGAREPFVLDHATARRMVKHAMGFRVRYGFNMQFSTVSRRLIDELAPRGPFFASAFPDYYATNVAFLMARTIAVTPQPLVTVGVTPKSYGFFHLNDQERAGRAFLEADDGARRQSDPQLADMPGTNINTGWLSAVEAIWERYGAIVPARPARGRFRLLQAVHVYEGHVAGTVTADEVAELERHLRPWERALAHGAIRASRVLGRRLPARLGKALHDAFHALVLAQFPGWNPPRLPGRYATVLEVFEHPPAPPPVARGELYKRLRRSGR